MANEWNNAIAELNELMHKNQEFSSALYQISQYNHSLEAKEVFTRALKQSPDTAFDSDESPLPDLKFLLTTARTLQKDFGAVDLSAFVEEREELTQEYAMQRSNFASINRTFADIVIKGPSNLTEEILLASAMAFLQPHEFKKAISTSMSIANVANLIDNSKIKLFTDKVIETVAPQKVKAAEEAVSEPMPNILGTKMGVLDSIQRSFENTPVLQNASLDDAKKPPKTPELEQPKDLGRNK